MASPSDEAVIARICAHMNRDHADNVQDYAAFYVRLPTGLAQTATLTSIAMDKLTLTVTTPHGAQSAVNIPLSPPMESLSDSRERLIAMANEAMEGLGRSRYKVTRWVPPGLVGALVCASVFFGYWAFFNGKEVFAPGGFVKENIFMGGYDAVTELLAKFSPIFFGIMLAIHAAECVWIHRTRLYKHGVKTGTGLWWVWILTTFAEGFGSVKRFDEEVRKLEREADKGAKKH